jgi:hypothetical protein
MGLLDDAIREHLELKRRRGADPSEIEREEVEALGPVRRGDVELDDDEPEQRPLADDEPPGLEDPGAAYDDEPAAPTADHLVPAEPPQTHDAPFAEDERDSATPPHGDPWVQQPTREFSADELEEALSDHHDAPPGSADPDVVPADAEGDDVLEETPDFLQETPEHDRLWFEQKPPKDFDF